MCQLCDNNHGELDSCQDCGCLICFDIESGDDVIRPAYVTASGDLFCDLHGRRHDQAAEQEAEEEAGYYPDPYEAP
jgi:hypothetical protein